LNVAFNNDSAADVSEFTTDTAVLSQYFSSERPTELIRSCGCGGSGE
jgi:hypothetical protein